MSLQHAAHYLASQGRGPDDTLVHMTRREVQSLQDIARAHGGSLTINPETGLVEAGFLKNLLPMIAGMGITALTGGAAAPWMIGLGVGGLQAARTGSLEKGLMAGLGAYGGAGLMGAGQAAAGAVDHMGAQSAAAAGDATAGIHNLPVTEQLKGAYAGLGTEAGRNAAMSSLGGGFGAAKTAGMALAPALMDSGNQSAPPADNERYNYKYDSGRVYNPNEGYTGAATGERTYFRPSYTRLPNSKGFADGGATDEQPVPQNPTPFSGNVPFAQAATPPAQVGSIQPTTSNPFYTMSGQSGDAYKYLMGQAPTSGTSPTIATKPVYNTSTTTTGGGGGVEGGGNTVVTGGTGLGDYVERTPYIDGDDNLDEYGERILPEIVGDGDRNNLDEYGERILPDVPVGTDLGSGNDYNTIVDQQGTNDTNYNDIVDQQGTNDTNYNDIVDQQGTNDTNYNDIVDQQGTNDTNYNDIVDQQGTNDTNYNDIVDQQGTDLVTDDGTTAGIQDVIDNTGTALDPSAYTEGTDYEVQPWENFDTSGDIGGSTDVGDFDYSGDIGGSTDVGDYGGYDSFGDFGGYGGGVSGGGRGEKLQAMEAANGGLMAAHRYAMGGSTLGGYSDGGRLLRGPGDGVSDSIPATIGAKRQPARLADGEFVVPARIVSELGNGSTEAGARKMYAMMERIQAARGNTVGRNRVATNTRADKHLPA